MLACEVIYAEGCQSTQAQARKWTSQVCLVDPASGERTLVEPSALSDPKEKDRFRDGDDDLNNRYIEAGGFTSARCFIPREFLRTWAWTGSFPARSHV